jgi:hypothetical protein
MTRAANVVNVSSNLSYIETDLALRNLKTKYKPTYGEIPAVYRRREFSGGQWTTNESKYYIISGGSRPSACPIVTSIGNGDEESSLCGSSRFVGTSGVGAVVEVNERPDLSSRGVLTSGEGASFITVGTSQIGNAIYNISKDELIRRWKTYLFSARNDASTLSQTTLYFHQRGSKTQAITTVEQLAQFFPRYFQFENEFNSAALAELTGGKTGNKFYADGQWWPETYIGLWDKMAKLGLSESVIRRELIDSGYTESQINIIRGVKGLTVYDIQKRAASSGDGNSGGSGLSSGGSGGGTSPNGNPWTGPEGYKENVVQTITVARSRNLFLTSEEVSSALTARNVALQPGQPVMYQVYMSNPSGNSGGTIQNSIINQFIFDVAPNEITYSGLGGEWVSIERTGGFPFIDWKNFKLLQVSFNFVIANKNGPVTADGLETPVTTQMSQLQRMAQTPFPVMFYGFDTMLTNQFRYDEEGNPRGIQFIIQDLTINAVRRNSNMEITRAQASITLQEIPIERQALIGMPKLRHSPQTPAEPRPAATPEEEYGKFTDQTPPADSNLTFNGGI